MAIEIPSLHGTRCRNLTVCGELTKPTKEILEHLAQADDQMVARYGAGKTTGYIRVVPGSKSGKHLHVDCAVPSYFGEGMIPKVTHKKADVIAVLEGVLGAEIDVGVIGYFHLPLTDIPEQGLIRNLQTKRRSGDLSIEVTGAELSIEGAPVRLINWKLLESGKELSAKILGDKQTRVSDAYLKDCLDWIISQMKLFILGRTEDEAH